MLPISSMFLKEELAKIEEGTSIEEVLKNEETV